MHTIANGSRRTDGEGAQGSDQPIERTAGTPVAVYRADLPIMVLAFRDNHSAAVTIPAGEIFKVVAPAQDDRFVVVDVKGEQFLVFECDLKYQGKPIRDRKAQGGSHAG